MSLRKHLAALVLSCAVAGFGAPALSQDPAPGSEPADLPTLQSETRPEIETLSRPSLPEWRQEINVLRIGILAPSGTGRELLMADPFRLHMQETLGLPVELIPARDTRALIDAIVNGRIDYARMSASAFSTGWALCRCLEPLATPQAADGTRAYHAIALAPARSNLSRLVDLEGKAVVFSEPTSLTGYLLPVATLRAQGIDTTRFFARQNHAASPRAAISAMLRGDYDVAFAWSSLAGDKAEGYSRGPLHRMVRDGALSMGDVRIVWQSDAIPHPPQVVRANLPEDLKSLLRAALFDLLQADPEAYDAAEPAFSSGFVAISRDDYAPLLHAFSPN
ncbi:phosphate/phosphite/phosphonate ABC transporter substrate-binding protein [Breoghania sp.]|uniref:phosphate/phosphite/phosphonate ABC transporter substrate-binding protein n=1 Tax=Breoghania sp. TaxID=2065378 RepID=UPI002AAA8A2D|nr:phosphate/phosphite/phosphonate ABC transporter substrate-binding protein [Breoghania sp.]